MKRIVFLILFITLFAFKTHCRDLIKTFNSIPRNLVNFNIKTRGGKYVIRDEGEWVEVNYNARKKEIRFMTDHEHNTYTYYYLSGKNRTQYFLETSYNVFGGTGKIYGRFRVVGRINGRWRDVTRKVVPKLRIGFFLRYGYNMRNYRVLLAMNKKYPKRNYPDIKSELTYKIKRKRTHVFMVTLSIGSSNIFISPLGRLTDKTSKRLFKLATELSQSLTKNVLLFWIPPLSRFVFSRR